MKKTPVAWQYRYPHPLPDGGYCRWHECRDAADAAEMRSRGMAVRELFDDGHVDAWEPLHTAPISTPLNPIRVLLWVGDFGRAMFGHVFKHPDGSLYVSVEGAQSSGKDFPFGVCAWQPMPPAPSWWTGEDD